jgi:hypothetical protein
VEIALQEELETCGAETDGLSLRGASRCACIVTSA